MKAQWLIQTIRVKQAAERAAKPDKLAGNGKRMNASGAMGSYGSGAHTQGLGTTYLFLANTGEVGHGSEIRKGVV